MDVASELKRSAVVVVVVDDDDELLLLLAATVSEKLVGVPADVPGY